MRLIYVRQANRDYCGPAVLQMTLRAFGIRKTQRILAQEAHTPRDPNRGTTIKNILQVLRSYGLAVEAGSHKTIAQIKRALAGGDIVIVSYIEPYKNIGHYGIVRKLGSGRIWLFDSDVSPNTSMPLGEFKERWKDPMFAKSVRWAAFVSSK